MKMIQGLDDMPYEDRMKELTSYPELPVVNW